MFSSAAHGSHVFRLTAATTTAPDEAEDDSTTAVDPPASSFLSAASSFLSTTAMDVNAIANYPPPHAGTKGPHSPVISESDRVSFLAVPTASSASEITLITTPLSTSKQPAKKQSRGSRQLAVSGSAKDIVSSAGKLCLPVLLLGCKVLSIGLLTFWKNPWWAILPKTLPLPLEIVQWHWCRSMMMIWQLMKR
jgi:hypothetical protein